MKNKTMLEMDESENRFNNSYEKYLKKEISGEQFLDAIKIHSDEVIGIVNSVLDKLIK